MMRACTRKWYTAMVRVASFLVFWILIGGVSSLADDAITTHGANSPAIIGNDNKIVIYNFAPQSLKTAPSEPDAPSSDSPHVATDGQGNWTPEDGYIWVDPDDAADRRVRWSPGKFSESDPHLVAASAEGQFNPQDGYVWVNPDDADDRRVRWVPGKLSENNPHVVAARAEGEFRAQDGYTWVNPDDPNDLRVEKME
jgi:hypothetical protein